MLTLSTTTATPSTSKTLSSSLALVEGERVLEAGAAAAADGDAQRLVLGALGLAAEQLADLLGGLVGEGDRCFGSLGHFTKCSWQVGGSSARRVCQNRRVELERPDRRRLRHHAYLPDRAGRRARHRGDQPLRLGRRRAGARAARSPTTPASTSGCAPRRAARPPRSPRSATSSPSTSRCSTPAGRSSRSTSPPASPAPSRRPARRASG